MTDEAAIRRIERDTAPIMGCHVWTAHRAPTGYGRLTYRGRTWLAHRLAWEAHHGAVPAGHAVVHTCLNPACVRIDHLEVVLRHALRTRCARVCRASTGYMRVRIPGHPLVQADGWVLEHRAIAWELGWLHEGNADHHVHHINHDCADNRPENLVVLSPAEHARVHDEAERAPIRRRVAELHDQGLSAGQIASAVGIDSSTVSRSLAREGRKVRGNAHYQTVPYDKAAGLAMLQAGIRPPHVARLLDAPVSAVRNLAREHGLSFPIGSPPRGEQEALIHQHLHGHPAWARERGVLA